MRAAIIGRFIVFLSLVGRQRYQQAHVVIRQAQDKRVVFGTSRCAAPSPVCRRSCFCTAAARLEVGLLDAADRSQSYSHPVRRRDEEGGVRCSLSG
jgi:hypothetical protein